MEYPIPVSAIGGPISLGHTFPLCTRIYDQSLSLCQPQGIDLPAMIEAAGLAPKWGSQKRVHKLAYVVHSIVSGSVRDARHRPPGFFVPLNARALQRRIGAADTRPALETLKALGVIEENPRYSAGRFSRSFRLSGNYRSQSLEWREVVNATLSRKVHSLQEAENAEAVAGDAVRQEILGNLSRLALAPASNHLSGDTSWEMSKHDINDGRWWFACDHSTGRVFHNVTQCPRELRRHLLIEGESVAEVDIANAQPFFLLSLYAQSGPTTDERAAFAEAVSSGYFYNRIFLKCRDRSQWGSSVRAWEEPGATHRDRFKKYLLSRLLYSDTARSARSQVSAAFADLFPWLAGELAFRLGMRDGASTLGRELQRQEAELMLGRVFPRIRAELPACRPISLHDGILCQAKFASAVGAIVADEAEKIYASRPTVRIKTAG